MSKEDIKYHNDPTYGGDFDQLREFKNEGIDQRSRIGDKKIRKLCKDFDLLMIDFYCTDDRLSTAFTYILHMMSKSHAWTRDDFDEASALSEAYFMDGFSTSFASSMRSNFEINAFDDIYDSIYYVNQQLLDFLVIADIHELKNRKFKKSVKFIRRMANKVNKFLEKLLPYTNGGYVNQ